MIDYAATALEALDALVEAGGASPGVTLTRTPAGVYDRTTSKVAPGAPVTTAGVGLVFDYELQAAGAGAVEGTLIRDGDKRLLLAAVDAAGVAIPAPVKGDACVAPDGLRYGVELVKTIAPAGVAVLYDVTLRR